ncbi:MAG TPA: hypothetical protein VLL05_08145 [Terriglobales bacterium]|nr:hypothetical protein [Terriglobales bacterium]
MPITIRRKNSLRNQLLTLILLSVLAGLIGRALVGFATGHHSSSEPPAASTS